MVILTSPFLKLREVLTTGERKRALFFFPIIVDICKPRRNKEEWDQSAEGESSPKHLKVESHHQSTFLTSRFGPVLDGNGHP